LPVGIDHLVEGVRSRLIKAVEHVKDLADQIKAHTLTKAETFGHTHINRKVVTCDAHVPAKIAVRREYPWQTTCIDAGLAERSVRQNGRPLVGALEIAVRVADGKNVKWPS